MAEHRLDEEMRYHWERWLRIAGIRADTIGNTDAAMIIGRFLSETGLAQVPQAVEWANAYRDKLECQ